MDKRKDSLSSLKLCRFCLSQDASLSSLYERSRNTKNTVPLTLKILSCVSIEVFPSDRMPAYICKRCKFFMELSYEYKQICRKADEKILHYVQTGGQLSAVPWPVSLSKTFHEGKLPKELGVIKTVEGGATIEVTAEESELSEDEDANIYDVKIGDNSGEEPKNARVTVVTSDQNKKKQSKEFTTVSKLARHLREHATERPYPCKYCEKSFLKSHHYTRHLRVKHKATLQTPRGPFGQADHGDQFKCEQCDDVFSTQDELIYHSAIHATQNLTCPLCQEKFDNVDAVTAHIKSHANGMEFMCDMCELVFTSKEKLAKHTADTHEDEMEEDEHDESSMEMEPDDEEDDNSINVKEEDGHMVVEIKKPNEFLLPNLQDEDEKMDNTNSEESETEHTYTELATVDTLALAKNDEVKPSNPEPTAKPPTTPVVKPVGQASILRKVEEAKRKVAIQNAETVTKKERPAKPEGGANDKSLRLLEKELQELKRTNVRAEAVKTPVKPVETLRNRRPQIHTSTPKVKTVTEDKKAQVTPKPTVVEKKAPERRVVTKENKEPKETNSTNVPAKEDKEKEKETPKSAVKNGNANTSDKNMSDEGIRRSTRPSKVKDYAKMIRDGSHDSHDDEDSDVEEEHIETDKSVERGKLRRSSVKPTPKAAPTPPAPVEAPASTPTLVPRKRGRPRKDVVVPPKIKKENEEEEDVELSKTNNDSTTEANNDNSPVVKKADPKPANATPKSDVTEQKASTSNVLVSPTGQTLKKIPMKSLPPGVKALPLPANARLNNADLCEMQIGKKMVKVQKIVMTKAEVEAMAKKGLVEIKDGTMMLKQGIKLSSTDPTSALKSSLVAEESPVKTEKATPTRCNFDEDS